MLSGSKTFLMPAFNIRYLHILRTGYRPVSNYSTGNKNTNSLCSLGLFFDYAIYFKRNYKINFAKKYKYILTFSTETYTLFLRHYHKILISNTKEKYINTK